MEEITNKDVCIVIPIYKDNIKDPYYFFKKYCVVKDKKTDKIVNIKFNRKQYERFIKYKITSNFR